MSQAASAVGPRTLFYFSDEVICNVSLQTTIRNDGLIAGKGHDRWEAVTPCSAWSNLDGFDGREARWQV